jgi:porphobilinogen deaminase
LRGLYPSLTVDLLGMTTKGDQIPDRSLAAVGGKRFLIKELEQAFEAKQAGPAVYSLKDAPMDKPPFVRIGLESLMMQVFKLFRSLNHLVGAQEQRRR